MQFWISVTSKDHVLAGLAGGYTQARGDKAGPLVFQISPLPRGLVEEAPALVERVAEINRTRQFFVAQAAGS